VLDRHVDCPSRVYWIDNRIDIWIVYPPKNGEIALKPNARVVKCKYHVSQKQDGFNNKNQWYNILLTFIFELTARL